MKKIIIIAVIVVLLGAGLFLSTQPLSLIQVNTTTQSREVGGISGNPTTELIPRKGFICSYISTEFSERITAEGEIAIDTWATGALDGARYIVYLKKDVFSPWEIVSDSGVKEYTYRNDLISASNPGDVSGSGLHIGGTLFCSPYDFEIRGNDYANGAVKVELMGHINENLLEVWKGAEWRMIASDEAYLYSGWGGLYLPTDEDGRPRSTFEIGEHVKIRVKTAYGAMVTSDEGKTWRIVLRDPNGNVYQQEDYGDNADTYFEFDVTKNMWVLGGDNEWQLEIFNTLVPKGTLSIDTIDFLANAPSDITFSASDQVKVGDPINIELTATINPDTQVEIDYFRTSAIYGTSTVLLPSDPLDNQWIFPPTEVTPSQSGNKYTYNLKLIPEHRSYVTIHAKAVDVEGRSSLHTKTFTFWAYDDVPADDDDIDEETGENDYGGGHTNPWYPPVEPDPYVVNLPRFNLIGFIVAIAIVGIFVVIALLPQIPFPYKAVVIVAGVIIAVVVYLLFYSG